MSIYPTTPPLSPLVIDHSALSLDLEGATKKIDYGSYRPAPEGVINTWHQRYGVALGTRIEALHEKHFGKEVSSHFALSPWAMYENPWWLGCGLEEIRTPYWSLREEEALHAEAFLSECRGLLPSIERNERHVMILTGRIRGGHETVARGLERDFTSKGYVVEVVYSDEPEEDRLIKKGVTYKGEPISFLRAWKELFISQQDPAAGELLVRIDAGIARDYPGECFERTVQKIIDFAPKLIISTCQHLIMDHYRYGVYADEFKLAVSDYCIRSDLPGKMKREGSILVPTYRLDCIESKLPLTSIPPAVDPSFLRPRTCEEMARLREEYKIPEGDRVVLLAFGSAPVSSIVHHACRELSKVLGEGSKVIVVSGDNAALLEEITAAYRDYLVLPKIGPEQMADLFYLSDCIIGKPGGGMCMQIEAVAIPHFLIYASYKNEKFNVAAMKKMGLGSVVGMNLREGVSDLKEKIIEGFSRADERRLAKRNK